MNEHVTKIYFIHEGKAAYPEIAAYRTFFAGRFVCEEIRPEEVETKSDLAQSVCWFIMGFHRMRPEAACVIHDYRSLSVGRLHALKDLMKRFLNAKPDIRIFQNREMQQAMPFDDEVPTLYLPMGVPPFVVQYRRKGADIRPVCDFCYIGAMSMERRSDLMIDSFLKRFGTDKLFHLYGSPEPALVARYRDCPNVVFCGSKSQEDVFAALQTTRVAVNYFPTHYPHRLQTPTKLLEYAALGLRILCNEQPQSRQVARDYDLSCLWGPAHDMFRQVPETLAWPDNSAFDPAPLLWPAVIAKSGIKEALDKVLGA